MGDAFEKSVLSENEPDRDNEVLVQVENVSKKFCRSLKRSLWYGLQDAATELTGRESDHALRKDEFWAVKDVSFKLRRGECLGLIGPNGAGKSTLLKMLNGLIKPDEGHIKIFGQVGALIELGAGFNPILTGRENVYINAAILGVSQKLIDQKLEQIIDFSGIEKFIDTPVQSYSSGMRIRLGFAISIALKPDILIVDEVLSVGDIKFRSKCYRHIKELMTDGTSIVLVTHSMHDLFRVANRSIVMSCEGKMFDGDVINGVVEYQKLCLENLKKEKSASFRARIKSASAKEFTEANPTVCLDAFENKSLSITIVIEASQDISNPILVIYFEPFGLEPIASVTNRLHDSRIDLIEGLNHISVKLPNHPFLPNLYSIHAALYNEDGSILFHRSRYITSFKASGKEVSILKEYFFLRLPRCSWSRVS
ncbi:ABC transporter ATP-binding protein [Oscillatoria sp. CS-180]|uniref:ABC transporter ATP-binding protein n=1 Tax=Oscillatoria sp. CS-180 TaxID=3021720 RepID=UPI002331136E|nr:ABC transporter ATP-binding protein [Oscillatoria sp. CS-180]MDB9525402.1 ABC transporter ATP-binding protein [Oscillatoria sp. CS-180]